ncbi:MAG: aminoglycoside phosphotransferase family protein [Candidatus Saccharimonadales bacterium]
MDEQLKQKLESDFPNLVIAEIKRIGEGWDNIAYLVNNEVVFRVPKKKTEEIAQEILDHTKTEIQFLKRIEGKLPVKSPSIKYVAEDKSYYGYTFASGGQVSFEEIKDKEGFVKLWIDTAMALGKSMPLDDATKMGVKQVSLNEYRLKRVKQVIDSKILDDELHELAEYTLQNYLAVWNQAPQFILHGDPGLGNWVYDEPLNTYTLIDWSDICIGPQEFQVYRLVNDMPDYVDLIIQYYFEKAGIEISQELIFLCGYASILSMLGAFMERGDEQGIRAKTKQLKFWKSLQG